MVGIMGGMHDKAAVGLLIRDDNLLLIKRVERIGDPWSGQIALPGGFLKDGETAEEAVLREVFEETSMKVDSISIVGSMPAQAPSNRRKVTVYPYVISVSDYLNASPGPEVADIRVVKLSDLVRKEGYYYGRDAFLARDWIIWGLTYKILDSYFNNEMAPRA